MQRDFQERLEDLDCLDSMVIRVTKEARAWRVYLVPKVKKDLQDAMVALEVPVIGAIQEDQA